MKVKLKTFFSFTFFLSAFHINGQNPVLDSLFHIDSLKRIVDILASDSLEGRLTGTSGNLKAALFIADEFKKAGVNPVAGNNGFFQKVKPSWFNVIGAIKGKSKPGQIIIFSAHYDHIGTLSNHSDPSIAFDLVKDKDGDEIFNGANDNASGVAAIITLAKFFKALDSNERTLLFVAFTGEELGLLGSKHLASVLETDSIVAMINIEMIGRSKQPIPVPFVTGANYSNLKKILNKAYQINADNSQREMFRADPYHFASFFTRSDNYPFALRGVPAHSIMLTAEDEFYHRLNDEANTLNYATMAIVIRAIAYGSRSLINGIDTPARIRGIR